MKTPICCKFFWHSPCILNYVCITHICSTPFTSTANTQYQCRSSLRKRKIWWWVSGVVGVRALHQTFTHEITVYVLSQKPAILIVSWWKTFSSIYSDSLLSLAVWWDDSGWIEAACEIWWSILGGRYNQQQSCTLPPPIQNAEAVATACCLSATQPKPYLSLLTPENSALPWTPQHFSFFTFLALCVMLHYFLAVYSISYAQELYFSYLRICSFESLIVLPCLFSQ